MLAITDSSWKVCLQGLPKKDYFVINGISYYIQSLIYRQKLLCRKAIGKYLATAVLGLWQDLDMCVIVLARLVISIYSVDQQPVQY